MGGVLQKDTIFSIVDNWNISDHEYSGIPLMSTGFFSGILRNGLASAKNFTFIVTTETVKRTAGIIKYLEKNEFSYLFFEDIVKVEIKKEQEEYSRQIKRDVFKCQEENMILCWKDRFESAGTTNNYFWQDLWAARKIFNNPAAVHYDIGSRVDGFDAHLLSFGQKVRVIDIRPLETKIEGMDFCQADATNLDMIEDESIDSLSALCSIEHFGLGRYGDPIDAEACFKCFDAIQRKMKVGGMVYLSLPIGKERMEFNACRIFYPATVISCFDKMELVEFSATNNGVYEENIEIDKYDNDVLQSRAGQIFGLFMFKKVKN